MNWEVRTMRSRTSFFNPTLFWKNVARFWPLWALYGVIWLAVLPLKGLNDLRQGRWDYGSGTDLGFHRDLLESAPGGIFLAVLFGVLAAMALFSYLYQGRSACMFHSLPIRREGLFLTNYLSGLAFFLVPNSAVALFTLLVELTAGDVKLWALGAWWLLVNGMCLFFFSFAVLLAMLTGHILALPAFYAIFNLLVVAVYTLLSSLLAESLYGFRGFSNYGLVEILTPAYGMQQATNWSFYDERFQMNSPTIFALYMLAGVVMAVLALLLYQRRRVESAGDVVAVSWLRPIFKYGVALCSGLAFGMATTAIIGLTSMPGLWVCIVLWTAVGCLVAEMLLRKSFRVLDSWKGAAAVAVVAALLCVGVEVDVLGYETRIPTADQVTSVTVDGLDSMPYDDGSSLSAQFTDPERIALVTGLHQAIVDQRNDPWDGGWDNGNVSTIRFYVSYDLADGSRMERNYYTEIFSDDLDTQGTVAYAAQALLNGPGMTEDLYGLDDLTDYTASSAGITISDEENRYGWQSVTGDSAQAQVLWQAVQADLQAGTLGTRYLFDTPQRLERCYFNDLTITLTVPRQDRDGDWYTSSRDFTVTLTTDAKHTLAVLAGLGISEETVLIPYGQLFYEDGTYNEYYGYPDSALWEKEQAETLWEGGAAPDPTPAGSEEALTTVAGVTAVHSAG